MPGRLDKERASACDEAFGDFAVDDLLRLIG